MSDLDRTSFAGVPRTRAGWRPRLWDVRRSRYSRNWIRPKSMSVRRSPRLHQINWWRKDESADTCRDEGILRRRVLRRSSWLQLKALDSFMHSLPPKIAPQQGPWASPGSGLWSISLEHSPQISGGATRSLGVATLICARFVQRLCRRLR